MDDLFAAILLAQHRRERRERMTEKQKKEYNRHHNPGGDEFVQALTDIEIWKDVYNRSNKLE